MMQFSPAKIRLLIPFTLIFAILVGWLFWPSSQESPYDLSRADGQSRFFATAFPERTASPNASKWQKIAWMVDDYRRRHGGADRRTYTFNPRPSQPCPIQGLLAQCMDISGTRYLIAVEIVGSVDFGYTNSLNGQQWVAAFESAIEKGGPVICYDYATKKNFEDTLLVIREKPRQVKIVPRTKLAEYQRLGLVRSDVR